MGEPYCAMTSIGTVAGVTDEQKGDFCMSCEQASIFLLTRPMNRAGAIEQEQSSIEA